MRVCELLQALAVGELDAAAAAPDQPLALQLAEDPRDGLATERHLAGDLHLGEPHGDRALLIGFAKQELNEPLERRAAAELQDPPLDAPQTA